MTKKIISALFLTIGAFFYQVDAQVSNLGVEVHPDNVSNTGTVTGIYANSFFMWTPALGLKKHWRCYQRDSCFRYRKYFLGRK